VRHYSDSHVAILFLLVFLLGAGFAAFGVR